MHTGAPRRHQTQHGLCRTGRALPSGPSTPGTHRKMLPSSQTCCSVDLEYFDISPPKLIHVFKSSFCSKTAVSLSLDRQGPRAPLTQARRPPSVEAACAARL